MAFITKTVEFLRERLRELDIEKSKYEIRVLDEDKIWYDRLGYQAYDSWIHNQEKFLRSIDRQIKSERNALINRMEKDALN